MKLTVRRKVRRVLFDTPYGTTATILVAVLAVTALGIYTDTNTVVLVGVACFVGFWLLWEESYYDVCPTCRSKVDAIDDRYCVTCGERLDELPASPPIDERVDERHRPVGLSDLERPATQVPTTDGGEARSEVDET